MTPRRQLLRIAQKLNASLSTIRWLHPHPNQASVYSFSQSAKTKLSPAKFPKTAQIHHFMSLPALFMTYQTITRHSWPVKAALCQEPTNWSAQPASSLTALLSSTLRHLKEEVIRLCPLQKIKVSLNCSKKKTKTTYSGAKISKMALSN